jgi:ABC-type multidrug transport system fused ATPase/permease subunit
LESLAGVITVRAFGWTAEYERLNRELLDRSQRPFYMLYTAQNWLKLVLDSVVAGLAVLVVGVAMALTVRHEVEAGFLGLALVNLMDVSLTLSLLLMSWTDLETSIGAVARIRGFVTSTSPEDVGRKESPPRLWPESGGIVFEGVGARYKFVTPPPPSLK